MAGPVTTAAKHLIAAGLSGQALLDALADIEAAAQSVPPPRSARQERNRRHYERKKERLSASEPDVSDVSDVSDAEEEKGSPPNPLSQNPLHPKKNPPTGVKKKDPSSRGTRLPSDWSLSQADLEAARAEGFSEAEARREAAKFRDYWCAKPGKDGVKVDWPATWRNWVRRSAESRGFAPRGAPDEAGDDEWRKRVERWRRTGRWSEARAWGEPPGEPGCIVPKHILAEFPPPLRAVSG